MTLLLDGPGRVTSLAELALIGPSARVPVRTSYRGVIPGRHTGAVLSLVTVVVDDYDEAIRFFVEGLRFELIDDSPSVTTDGRPKRWIEVRPPGCETGVLLALADGSEQRAAVGNQVAGRVGFFLRVENFQEMYDHLVTFGVTFVTKPRSEPYGTVAVFLDIAGNRWDLLGPAQNAA